MYPQFIQRFCIIEFENGAVLWFDGNSACWRYEGGYLE